ncbi:MAG: beta-ketoacyl-ACP synthase II [Deltaproteobacteria bacterium]|nr:beta-ketoacyl-ACP synthase II [Deltaproteobacteria bacterium]
MRRVVITGIGLVTPIGIGVDENWQSLLTGRSGIGPITQFDCSQMATRFAGEVKDFDPTRWIDKREVKTIDRFLQFAVVAGKLALEDSGLPPKLEGDDAERAGCYVGAGLGGIINIEKTHLAYLEKGARHGFSPYFVPGIIVNLAPGQLSIRHNLRGPCLSHVSACSTGAHSIGEAMRAIQHDTCDVMVAGGCEATVSVLAVGGFNAARALSTRNEDPQRASRPFDSERDGFVIAEGAGVLVLEELAHAKRRGARIYAELKGYAATADAHHITAPAPEGEGAQRCMRLVLRDAKLPPEAIGYINAHGTSTKFNDASESFAVKKVFGDHAYKLAMSSTKSMTGHTLGAAGGIETAYSALALSRNVLPPTTNYENPDPECDLDYIPNQPRELRVEAVLSNSFGFGGTNAALVLTRYRGD